MVQPVLLIIRKATTVPTNEGSKHQYRTDWERIETIDYGSSLNFFHCLNYQAPMKTDAQFALWLCRSFGPGRYLVLASQKGREGFWNFMKVQCMPEGFMRLPKHQSQEEREREENRSELRRLQRNLDYADSDEKWKIQRDIDELEDNLYMNNEIIDIEREGKSGCYPFLATTMPIYNFHAYEEYEGGVTETENYGPNTYDPSGDASVLY